MHEGKQRAEALARAARALGHAPLQARAVLHLAAFERELGQWGAAERSYREALWVGLRGKADEVAAKAAVALVGIVGDDAVRHDEAEAWAELAAALLGRSGNDPSAEAELLTFRASILRKGGRLPEASDALQRALSLTERAHGQGDARVAKASAALAEVLAAMGDPDGARRLYERALRIDEATVGRDHPNSAAILYALGELSRAAGAMDDALGYHGRALEIRQTMPGDHALALLASLRALAVTYSAMGRDDTAAGYWTRALDVAETGLGPTDPATIATLAERAQGRMRQGEPASAVVLLEDAVGRMETALPRRKRPGRVRPAPRADDLQAALQAARAQMAVSIEPSGEP